ncbi:MAG TPA: DUF2786 domain-containing protein [Candidatus Limnocylindrales bacterium]|nr:DUF2786 domain-containing protein [Candidatus Limnocylindrales bacterium]
MGRNSRDRHKAKRKAAQAQRHRPSGVFGASTIPAQLQITEEIILEALHARYDGRQAEVERCRTLLAGGPGGSTGVQVVNRALFTVLLNDVRQTWERGWQPVELVRLARREHTVRHGRLMVDAIAAQMRVYAAATVDPRWRSQLVALGAEVWWDHDDHYVNVWAEQQGLDRATAVDHFLDLLYLLQTLPAIDRVGPVPGTATFSSSAAAGSDSEVDQRMLHRIRALLAKAESTEFPEEAEAFTAKAQQLMARHSIDHALLAARTGGREEPVSRRIAIDNPYEAPKTLLLQVVAGSNRCRSVWMKRYGLTTVVGYPSDLDSVELLFTSLLVQATKAMTQNGHRRNNIRAFRQSFMTAYAMRIGERLNAATQEVDREAAASTEGSDLLPVLAARSDAVKAAFDRQFPELTSHATPINSREGWASGRAAADRAVLHGRQAVTG